MRDGAVCGARGRGAAAARKGAAQWHGVAHHGPWLNAPALKNIWEKSVTALTSQVDTSGLHVAWSIKRPAMLVTRDVSQVLMSPW